MSDAADAGLVTSPPRDRRAPFRARIRRALTALPGPVFQKEVWVLGRRVGTYWVRGLYGAGLLLVCFLAVLIQMNAGGYEYNGSSVTQQINKYQRIAPMLTFAVIWFQFIAIQLAAAVQAGPAICDEKRAGTLGTLLTTPITATQIVLGKLSAALVQLFILLLLSVPILLAVRVFGGVTAWTVFAAIALTAMSSVLTASIAIYFSIHAKRSPTAILLALLGSGLVQVGVPLALGILATANRTAPPMWAFFSFSPPLSLAAVSFELTGEGAPPINLYTALTICLGCTSGLTLLILWASVIMLRRSLAAEHGGGQATAATPQVQPPPSDSRPSMVDTGDGTRSVTAPKRQPAIPIPGHSSRIVDDDPVMWRELRQSFFHKRLYLFLSLVAVIGLMIWVYAEVGLTDRDSQSIIATIAALASVCIAAIGTTNGINSERESRTLDALLTTPLSVKQIITAKFYGALRRQWFFPTMSLLGLTLIGVPAVGVAIGAVPLAALILLGPIVFLSATGLWLSTVCKRMAAAAAINLVMALGIWLGFPLLLAVLQSITNSSDTPAQVVLCFNPVAMTAVFVSDSETPWNGTLDIFDFNLSWVETTLVIVGVFLAYVIGASVALAAAIRRMNRDANRVGTEHIGNQASYNNRVGPAAP